MTEKQRKIEVERVCFQSHHICLLFPILTSNASLFCFFFIEIPHKRKGKRLLHKLHRLLQCAHLREPNCFVSPGKNKTLNNLTAMLTIPCVSIHLRLINIFKYNYTVSILAVSKPNVQVWGNDQCFACRMFHLHIMFG